MSTSSETAVSQPAAAGVDAPRGGLRRRLLSGGLWVIGARLFGMASTVLANVVLARQLTVGSFGEFVLICSIANAASLFAMFGLNSAVVRFVGEQLAGNNRQGARHVLGLCYRLALGTTFITAVAVLCGVFLYADQFRHSEAGRVAVLIALTLSLQGFCNLSAAALRGMGEMRHSSILGGQGGVVGPFANSLFLVLVAIGACCTRLTLESTLVLYVSSFAVVLVVGSTWVRRTASTVFAEPTPDAASSDALLPVTTLFTACLPMLVVQVLSIVAKQGSLWVAGETCGGDLEQLGLYAGANRAIQLVGIPLSFVNMSVMGFIPQLRMQNRLVDLERVLRVGAGWAAIPSFCALLLFLCVPGPVLAMFLGPEFRAAAPLLSILSVGQFALVWVGCCEQTLMLSGQARAAAVVNVISASTILIGGYFVGHVFGMTGLAILASSVLTAQCLCQWLLARRLLGVWTHAAWLPWRLMRRMQ